MPQSFPCIDPSLRPGVLFKAQELDWSAANLIASIQLPPLTPHPSAAGLWLIGLFSCFRPLVCQAQSGAGGDG